MPSWPNEVQASMDTQVGLLRALGLLLLSHICLMLVVNEVDDGAPRVAVVHVVAKARGVDDSELDLELFLLELSLDNLNLSELVKLFVMAPAVVLGRRELGRKKGVDESRLAQPRLACTRK